MKFHKDGTLPQNGEVFVFGSNLAGIHGGGAALVAKQQFGALQGSGSGPMSSCYAIPTKDATIANSLPLELIKGCVQEFLAYANLYPNTEFFVTRIGCVLAGYSDAEIAPMFADATSNCSFAERWREYLWPASKPATALVLRCCAADMTSRNGFVWPGVGETATAPDWRYDLECGGGLHGWLYGAGDHTASDYWREDDEKWLVLEVEESGIRNLDRKCKFPGALVRFVGDKAAAAAYLVKHEPRAVACDVIGLSVVAGDHQTAASGPLGKATAGFRGTATAGDWGTATAGNLGAANAGNKGMAAAGKGGTATAGKEGQISTKYYDSKANRYRTAVGYVGEDGIEANVAYKLGADHKFIKAAQ